MTPEQELIAEISKYFTDEIARMENQEEIEGYIKGFTRGMILAKKLYKKYDEKGNEI